jgi:uncharacterized C2H2 Zn-finger protein
MTSRLIQRNEKTQVIGKGFEFWHCKRCGWICNAQKDGSIGTAHAHAEKHANGQILGFTLPTTWLPTADPVELDKHIEKIKVEELDIPDYTLSEVFNQ